MKHTDFGMRQILLENVFVSDLTRAVRTRAGSLWNINMAEPFCKLITAITRMGPILFYLIPSQLIGYYLHTDKLHHEQSYKCYRKKIGIKYFTVITIFNKLKA